jgi:sialate O-acetylesterase
MRLSKMIFKSLFVRIVVFFLLVATTEIALAQNTPGMPPTPPQAPKTLPFVSPLFSDNMVLQRGKINTIWGWSEAGDKITIQIGDTTATGVASPNRRWEVKLNPPPVGGPYTIKISGPQTLVLSNVMVGDVWLCGGQSNMGLPLRFTRHGAEDAKTANYPDIRFFSVMGNPAYRHTDLIGGRWSAVTPESADWVSAVGYYFARKVQLETHVPIGLVSDNMGGTPAEAWTSTDALRPLKDFDLPLAEVERLAASGAPEYGNYVMHWYDEYDLGLKGKWASPDLDDSSWKPVEIPGGFAELGVPSTPALAWFRKEIVLPDPLPDGRAMLLLGSIERMDTAYVNGKEVGGSSWVENPRAYFLGPDVLKPGRNVIALRVLKTKPDGGFLSKPEELHVVLGDKTSIPLAGAWKAKLSVDARPPRQLPSAYENWPIMPAVLYEGMLKPIAPLSIAGALWYQGEQNSPRGYQYRKILPAMISDWRKLFGQGDFPFYIVSLPAFKARSATPVDGDEWTETRESQALTAVSVPNSCLAVTIDTGDPDNIHSPDKVQVGERLALCALANYYGQKVVYSGPAMTAVDRLPGEIRIHFAHTDGGLVVKGEKLGEFAIAGADRKWAWAEARIEGDAVVVSSASVPDPKEVRYAWQSNPLATLFNGAGLPAAPFRSDNWPGLTDSARPY